MPENIMRKRLDGLTGPSGTRSIDERTGTLQVRIAETEAAVTKVIALRQHMQPYIHEQMEKVSLTGQPINRPLFWDFPEDPNCWAVDDSCVPPEL